MKLHVAAILSAALSLTGCASQAELQAQARAVAMQDDATCRGYGAKPGSPIYVQCRMQVAGRRETIEAAESMQDDAIAAAMAAQGIRTLSGH